MLSGLQVATKQRQCGCWATFYVSIGMLVARSDDVMLHLQVADVKPNHPSAQLHATRLVNRAAPVLVTKCMGGHSDEGHSTHILLVCCRSMGFLPTQALR